MRAWIERLWTRPAPTYRVVRWLFPRLLALCYLIAFWSWDVQCDGLVGEHGILPAKQMMENVHAYEAREHESVFEQFPGVFYWRCDDAMLHGVCRAGAGLSLLVMAGVLQGPLLASLWFGYLSIAVTGAVFMGFQWDALLLEAGLLCLFFAPWRLWTGGIRQRQPDAPAGSVFLLHWLLFRLMLLSGYVKWGGGDKPWLDLTALTYHFETQPLPNPVSWWAHNLPRSVHVFDCWVMYVIELALPLLMWMGRWGRLAACAGYSALMAGVAFTGNYNFFNLLTIFLSITLLDDNWWPRWLKARLGWPEAAVLKRWQWRHAGVYVAAAFLVLMSLVAADEFLAGRIPGYATKTPDSVLTFHDKHVAPWRSVNAYGLFQQMTIERPELDVQVSDDMVIWSSVPFRWKPGDVMKAPRWAAPYQPRLDWQMWFAALYPSFVPERDMSPQSGLSWFGPFLEAVMNGRKEVWDLLGEPPIPLDTIRGIRVVRYRYHFTTPEERKATGAWWKREAMGLFSGEYRKK